jgi:hypothetical protein
VIACRIKRIGNALDFYSSHIRKAVLYFKTPNLDIKGVESKDSWLGQNARSMTRDPGHMRGK